MQSTVATDLELNGLELESASLTKLDQTDTKFFNPNNAFDAEGLAALTRIVEARRQERNQTVRNAEVAIAQQDLDATQKTLEILRMKKDAELSQQRDIAIAERDRQTAVIAARKTAEQEATRITVSAQAEREAAENRASAIRTIAQAEADAAKIEADGQATTYQVDADGQRKLNEARNAMSDKVIGLEVARERLRTIPVALAEAVKPLQNIGDVKIIDMGGMPGRPVDGTGKSGRMDMLVDSLLAYRANAPVIDTLLAEAGFPKHGGPIATLFGGASGVAAPDGDGTNKTEGAGTAAG